MIFNVVSSYNKDWAFPLLFASEVRPGGKSMCPSDNVQAFLNKILAEEDESDQSAEKADRRNQKVYDRIRDLVLEKDGLKVCLDETESKEERMQIQLSIVHLEREFNDLLNVLSMDAMEN